MTFRALRALALQSLKEDRRTKAVRDREKRVERTLDDSYTRQFHAFLAAEPYRSSTPHRVQ